MKYIIGSFIISFGILLVVVAAMSAMNIKAPENTMQYLGLAWLVLAICCYPLAKNIIR